MGEETLQSLDLLTERCPLDSPASTELRETGGKT